ncbi:MAG TPA: PAS domain-containing protein [Burkholderiales bacterium]|nr:PAS domain-containing protein [Burkholderiales bacterium]
MESHSLNLPQWAADISQELLLQVKHDGAIVAANPACARVLGYSEPELHGHSFFDLVHPEDLERTRMEIVSATAGASRAFDNRFRHRDGAYRPVAWVATGGGPDVYLAGLDRTAEKSALESLRQSTRTELLGQLTRGIVHDFNNSLQNIVAALELVRKLVSAGRGAEAERFIANAIAAAQRAASVNERLLGFAGQRSDARPTSLNELIAGMDDMARRALPPSLKLVVEPAANLWASHFDVGEAQGAVLNLVIHARDVIPDGGIITIKTCNSDDASRVAAHAACVPPGEYACLVITHAGAGVRSQAQDNAPQSARLTLAAQFARAHGGDAKLHVDAAGEGTVVVWLPRYMAPGSA